MKEKDSLEGLWHKWEAFLVERGHKVTIPREIQCVLLSRDRGKRTSRWVLLLARGTSRTLNQSELEDLRLHLRRARALNQKVYVVVQFQKDGGKLVVWPAERVLKRKQVFSQKGGIPWND